MDARRAVRLVVIAFVLNWLWEMAHMSAYAGIGGSPWWSTALRCARASAVDAAIVVALSFAAVWLTHGRRTYVVAGVLGLLAAAIIEGLALSTGRWTYGPAMPVVPVLGLGAYPLLQLAALTPLSLWASAWVSRRRGLRS